MSPTIAPAPMDETLRRTLRLAGGVLIALIVGIGGLTAVVSIRGAVIASAELTVSSEVKKIQHPSGGVVAQIRVRDGTRVRAGELLLTLDSTAASANADIVGEAVAVLTTRQARLEAERDGQRFTPPADIAARRGEPAIAAIIEAERKADSMRRVELTGQKSQLRERQSQLRQQISGRQGEIASKKRQIELLQEELVGIRKLWDQGLVPLTRLNSLERAVVELDGGIARLNADIAEARDRSAEIEIQILQVDQNSRADAGRELAQLQGQLTDARQRKVTTDQDSRRVSITAPQDGVVDQLAVHTIGGVIAPGETIMVIVPDRDRLYAEARIRRTDVDQVRSGQLAALRLTAFDGRTTPEITGVVDQVSADAHTSEREDVSYYLVRINIPQDQLSRLGGRQLTPGMPVEAFIQTDRRTLLSYLTRPLSDQLRRAFREQ